MSTQKVRNYKQSATYKNSTGAIMEDTLHHQAFDNSLQASILSTINNGKVILANRAACKLLGYSIPELLTKSRADIFDINESSFKRMLKQRMADGHSTALVKVVRKNGQLLPCHITSAVFVDENGIEKSITTIADMSHSILKQKKIDTKKRKIVTGNIALAKTKQIKIDTKKEKIVADNIIVAQAKSDARLAENNEWIKYIAKTSYDVMWDWDILTGEIYVGDSIEEVFGYKLLNNTVNFANFSACLLPGEKDTVEKNILKTLASNSKSWKDSYMFKRHDGSVAFTTSRASIVRDEHGKAIRMIGAIHDVSKLKELEEKLENQIIINKEDSDVLLTPQLSFDVIWEWNILTNEIFMGEGFEQLFGYSIQNNIGNIADWANYLHPNDREAVKKGLHDAIESSAARWQHTYRFIRSDGSIAKVLDRASIFRHADGKAYRMIGVMLDITRQNEQNRSGIDLPANKKSILVKKIKNVIVELVHYTDEQLQTNFSNYLSNKLQYDYTYLANLFSEVEGISIQTFIISQKIERVKELMVSNKFNLTEIASQLHYSSVAHLSNQFKKVTGFTPSHFKQLHLKHSAKLENV